MSLPLGSTGQDVLPMAIVNIFDKRKRPVHCRALIDTASTKNFITEELANKLGMQKLNCSIPIGALNELSTVVHRKIHATVASRLNGFTRQLSFLIIPRISGLLPTEQVDRELLEIPPNLPLADPEFHKPASVQLLLGSSTSIAALSIGQIKLPKASDIYLQKTQLGWILCGNIGDDLDTSMAKCHFTEIINEFKKFWEIEDIGIKKSHQSEIETACEEHFKTHVSRTPEGRYVVALPFNQNIERLGTSYLQAKRRLLSLERKFQWNPTLKADYTAVIDEYKQLGHMKRINTEVEEGFYLPHHAVFKETSLTTKTRVVFDGSARSSTGISLNDALMVGPTIQDDILSLVLRFRLHNFILTGDIEKMYRQILVTPEERKFQRILWRENGKIETYELQTVTFGLAPAPYLAVRCLHQLADDERERFPLASAKLKQDLYVDDLLTGTSTLEEALQLLNEIIDLLSTGGFNLRQCASNSPDVLHGLPDSTVNIQLLGEDDSALKTLGVRWDSKTDTIVYTINPIATRDTVTMRTIASDVARIYDPLGLLNPVITHAKIIQQQLWRFKLDWDDSVPAEIHTQWDEFASQLPLLNEIHFKRQVTINKKFEIHGFCDASSRAYGACIYLRSISQDGDVHVNLYCAKSRITPINHTSEQTTPRLELCAAELLSNLYDIVKKATHIEPERAIFWSNSTVVLHWIKTPSHLLQRFVANRVARIQELTNTSNWRHVRTHENPADAISRGQLSSAFLHNHLWKHGPAWLQEDEEHWPHFNIGKLIELPELKKATVLIVSSPPGNPLLQRYSSFERLKRILALCLRWRTKVKSAHLTLEELKKAETQIIQLVQQETFKSELSLLEQGKSLPPKSRLINLSLQLDDDHLIHVGGRLKKHKTLPLDGVHPILLPKGHHVTNLIIQEAHLNNLHSGIQNTLHTVRQRYWPVDGRNQTRFLINKCISCTRVNPSPVNYPMGSLPRERITQSRPFEHTGVDYCGPFFIKEKKLRNRAKIKVWVSIFVCFSTKAVHIELVSDLTTEEFLATLSRFLSRHPSCKALHSDNATTFTGAYKELKELYNFIQDEQHEDSIRRNLIKKGIEWHFIPPISPHCGGLWEAAVKSCKHHMKRVIGNELLTYQQLNTLCVKIEGILNSRPLTPLSSDPNDFSALTPAHFLHGESTTDLPAPNWSHTPTNRLSQWQHLEQIKQHFWARWHKEYLSELNVRHKWTSGSHDITIGSLVLLRDDNPPPLKWRMGRIIEVFPGEDGIIRKVKVRTSTNTVDRNVRRLAPLPMDPITSTEDS
ncbi:uncharacterized protein LOC107044383 [Diachasma alloeum]|uniref:uncharacterized protein LOC107044383 n=1 Tax=Diachasma alloeum TaxID=454923 RepID=UPI0007382519|nr:uncharacterized protein LOC107044383 [Diachasma alloeum]